MINKNTSAFLSIIFFIIGLFANKSYVGSIFMILSMISFSYWMVKTSKNRTLALIIIAIVVLLLYSLLPLVRIYL